MPGANFIRIIFYALVFVMLSGCASVKVRMYDKTARYPATEARQIEIFREKPLAVKFIEIGEITVEGAAGWDEIERIFRARAAGYGGNAVYVRSIEKVPRTYTMPCGCDYYDGFFFPGDREFSGYYFHGHRYYYFPHGYCYGHNDKQTIVFLNVVGIVIRYI